MVWSRANLHNLKIIIIKWVYPLLLSSQKGIVKFEAENLSGFIVICFL